MKIYFILVFGGISFFSCTNESYLLTPKLEFNIDSFPIKDTCCTNKEIITRGNIDISYIVLDKVILTKNERNLLETKKLYLHKSTNVHSSFSIIIDENDKKNINVEKLLKVVKIADSVNNKPPHIYSYSFVKSQYRGYVKECLELDSLNQTYNYLSELAIYVINKRVDISINIIDDFSNLYKINESRVLLNSLEINVKSDSLEVLPKNQPSNPGW
jgi:hypothetical protein